MSEPNDAPMPDLTSEPTSLEQAVALLEPLTALQKAYLFEQLTPLITASKLARMDEVLALRTRHLTLVVEELINTRNAAAVIRSSDGFGVQDVHVIEGKHEFMPRTDVAAGSTRWVQVHRYFTADLAAHEGTTDCLAKLKQQGYRIVATTLREGATPIQALDLKRPFALCLGNEEVGLSEVAHRLADEFVYVPMLGFTQSFNISVTAAICLYEIRNRLQAAGIDHALSPAARRELKLQWLIAALGEKGPAMADEFLRRFAA